MNHCAHHQCSAHREPRKASSLNQSRRSDQKKHHFREPTSPASSLHDADLFRADCSDYNVATLPTWSTGRKDKPTKRRTPDISYSHQYQARRHCLPSKPAVSRQTQTEHTMVQCPRCQEGGKFTPSAGLTWKNRERLFDEPSSSDLTTSDALNALSLYQTTSGSVVSAVTTKSRNAKIFADSSALQEYQANMEALGGAKVILGRRKHHIQEEVVQLNPMGNRNVVIGHKANCGEEECKRCHCCPQKNDSDDDRRYFRTVTPVRQSKSDENFSTARQDSSPARQDSSPGRTSGWDTFTQLKNASTKWKQVAKNYIPRTNSEFWREMKEDLPESSLKPESRAAWQATPGYQEDASDRMFGTGQTTGSERARREDIQKRWRDVGAKVNRTIPNRRPRDYRESSEPYKVPSEEARRRWRKMAGRANALSQPRAHDRYAGDVSEEGYGPFESIKQKWQKLGVKARNMMMPRRDDYAEDNTPSSQQRWRDAGRQARHMTRIGRQYSEDAVGESYHPNQDVRNKWQNFGARANNMIVPKRQRGYLDEEGQNNTRSHWQKARHDEEIETSSPNMRTQFRDFGDRVNRTMWPGKGGDRDTPPDIGSNADRDMWEGRERDRDTGSERSTTPDFNVRQKWRNFSTRVGQAVWPGRTGNRDADHVEGNSPDSDVRQRWRKIGARAYKFMPGRRSDDDSQSGAVGPGQYVRDKWRDLGATINKMTAPAWRRDNYERENEPINETVRRKFRDLSSKVNRMMTPSRGPQGSSEDDYYSEDDSFIAPMPSGWAVRQDRYSRGRQQDQRRGNATCTKKVRARSTEAFYRPDYLHMNEWNVDAFAKLPRNANYISRHGGYKYEPRRSIYDDD